MKRPRFLDEVGAQRGTWNNKVRDLMGDHLGQEHSKPDSEYSDLQFEAVLAAFKLLTRHPGMYAVNKYNRAVEYCHKRGAIHSRYMNGAWHYRFCIQDSSKVYLVSPNKCCCQRPKQTRFRQAVCSPWPRCLPGSKVVTRCLRCGNDSFQPSTFQASCPEPQWTAAEAVFQM